MYLQNKYTIWYYNIINRAKVRSNNIDTYTELHHILPKSLGGNNSKDNLVELTAREHFICHWLLTKMVTSQFRYKMWNALSSMTYWHNNQQQREKINSKKYEIIKSRISKEKSIRFAGKNNPMYGKTHTDSAKNKIRKAHIGKEVSIETRNKLKISQKHKGPNFKLRGINNAMNKDETKKKRESYFLEKYGVKGPGLVPWVCEKCGKNGKGLINLKRWHNDNCKSITT